jgi:hypothetical protein
VAAGEVAPDDEVALRSAGVTGRYLRVQESGRLRSLRGGGHWGCWTTKCCGGRVQVEGGVPEAEGRVFEDGSFGGR